MPRFYFDIEDGPEKSWDLVGIDLPDLKAARDAAIGVLPEIASDELPNGAEHRFKSEVRDESGKTVFRASLTLKSEYVDD